MHNFFHKLLWVVFSTNLSNFLDHYLLLNILVVMGSSKNLEKSYLRKGNYFINIKGKILIHFSKNVFCLYY